MSQMKKMIHYPNDPEFGLTRYEYCADRPNKQKIGFSPLLSLQRYRTVSEVLCKFAERSSVSTVAEFGSHTFTFFHFYLLECDFIDTVHQVDIDENPIRSGLHIISTERERRFRIKEGRKPLVVNIFKGNVAEKDDRLLNSDVVIGIELIEHLTPADFERFPETIFGFIEPKLVVLTTPNYDFNVLFENGGAFRNEDHKFEFTRQQFQDWADGIVAKYPAYTVQFYGIGEPPENCSLDVGFCSQMAIFERSQSKKQANDSTESYCNYTPIGSYNYFDFEKIPTKMDEIRYDVNKARAKFGEDERYVKKFPSDDCDHHQKFTLPLEFLLEYCGSCYELETLETALEGYSSQFPVIYVDSVPYLVTYDECDCYSE